MKKLLGISLVAMLAVSPLAANAAAVAGSPTSYGANQPEGDAKAAVLGGAPLYQLVEANGATDGNAASAGYVKGAYNAAIKAVNKVHDEVTSLNTNALTTAGNGLAKDGNTVSVDMTTNGGLQFTGETDGSKTVGVKAGNGIELDSTGVNVKAKADSGIAVDSNGVSVDYGNTLEMTGTAGSKKLDVKVGDGIKKNTTSGAIEVDLSSNKGLQVDATAKTLEVKAGNGIELDSTGVKVKAKTDGGITVDSNGVSLTNGVQGATNTTTYGGTGLTTQGYVDEKVATVTSGMVTETGIQELSNKTLNGGTLKTGTTLTATGATISGGTISGATIDASANTISNITASQMATSAKATGTANNDKVTTQGYVDDAITGLGTTYATKTGVDNTINALTYTTSLGTFTLTSGAVTGTATVPIMDDWSHPDTPAATELAVTKNLSVGTAITNGSATTTASTASYTTANTNP